MYGPQVIIQTLFQMKSLLALVVAVAAVSQCAASSDERGEPDLRIYKSFYRGGRGAAASEDSNVGQRYFPASTSNGGSFPGMVTSGTEPKTTFGSRVGGSGFFPGRRTNTATAVSSSGEELDGGDSGEEANEVVPRRGVAG